jgi:hypothetical protein
MVKGHFQLNVMDEIIQFNYETNVPPSRYKEFEFVFVPGGETMVMRGGASTTAIKNFLVDDVVRQRVFEQTGTKPAVIAVSVT